MTPPTRWTWVWVNSGSRWWTWSPGVLQFMEPQRVRHDWTELSGNWLGSLWLGSSRNKLFSQKRMVLSLQVVWTIWIASCLNWAVWTVSCLAVRKWSFYSREKPLRNEVPVILIFWGWLPIGTPVDFIFKNHGPSQWTLLTKWTDLTKGNLEY